MVLKLRSFDSKSPSFYILPKKLILFDEGLGVIVLLEGEPLPEPESGLLSNTWKWIVQGDTCTDKARDFVGEGRPAESSGVREPRRTALPCGSQSQVLW